MIKQESASKSGFKVTWHVSKNIDNLEKYISYEPTFMVSLIFITHKFFKIREKFVAIMYSPIMYLQIWCNVEHSYKILLTFFAKFAFIRMKLLQKMRWIFFHQRNFETQTSTNNSTLSRFFMSCLNNICITEKQTFFFDMVTLTSTVHRDRKLTKIDSLFSKFHFSTNKSRSSNRFFCS